jgi:hypothetical protein
MSSVSLYSLPKYQTNDLELNLPGYHVLIFVDYKNKQVLKEFKSSEGQVRAVFVGRGTRDVYEWINYEGIQIECYWSGPMGKYCELCKQFGIEDFPHYLVFRNDCLLYSSNEPPTKELKYLGLSSSEEFAKEILNELIVGLFPAPKEQVHKVEFSLEIAELQNQLTSVTSVCEEQKKIIEILQTSLIQKEEEISQYKKKL